MTDKSVDEVFDMPDDQRAKYIEEMIKQLEGKKIESVALELVTVEVTPNIKRAINVLGGIQELKSWEVITKAIFCLWEKEPLLDNRLLAKLMAADKVEYKEIE